VPPIAPAGGGCCIDGKEEEEEEDMASEASLSTIHHSTYTGRWVSPRETHGARGAAAFIRADLRKQSLQLPELRRSAAV
jgi:hypothetical protein